MIAAVHALVGAVIGRVARHKPGALAGGIASHLICDLLPHKDFHFKVEAPLLAVVLGFLALKFGIKSNEFVGACGAVAPDAENAASVLNIIPKEAMRFPTHRGDDKHGPKTKSALPQGILAVACVAYLLWPRKK